MREVVSKQGKAYDRVVRELDRDQYREYVLSVRHSPAGDADPEPVLSDWLPVCEVIVADKQQYEARKFFKENNMDIPETEQQSVSAEQIEGVPAIKAAVPKLGADLLAMAAAMAGSNARNVDVSELEFGVEDWGSSSKNAVDGLEAQAGAGAVRESARRRRPGPVPRRRPRGRQAGLPAADRHRASRPESRREHREVQRHQRGVRAHVRPRRAVGRDVRGPRGQSQARLCEAGGRARGGF